MKAHDSQLSMVTGSGSKRVGRRNALTGAVHIPRPSKILSIGNDEEKRAMINRLDGHYRKQMNLDNLSPRSQFELQTKRRSLESIQIR